MGRADDSVLAGFDPEWNQSRLRMSNNVHGTTDGKNPLLQEVRPISSKGRSEPMSEASKAALTEIAAAIIEERSPVAVVKNKSTPEGRAFWRHVEAVAGTSKPPASTYAAPTEQCKHDWVSDPDCATYCDRCGIFTPQPSTPSPEVARMDTQQFPLPCPFCGSAPIVGDHHASDETGENNGYFFIECNQHSFLFCGVHADTPEECLNLWNDRLRLSPKEGAQKEGVNG